MPRYVEMPRPIETLLSLPRVRLIDKVPVIETERYVNHFISQSDYTARLVQRALQVSEGSAEQFSTDDKGLSTLLDEVGSAEYVVTERSKSMMEEMLSGICADGLIFKDFEQQIMPLYEGSRHLRDITKVADDLVYKTREESLDLARALVIEMPIHNREVRVGRDLRK